MMPEQDLLTKLTPDVRVVIWSSDAPLSKETPGFASVDYLLDGLVQRHLETEGPWHSVTFVHNLFGETFWLAYTDAKGSVDEFLGALLGVVPTAAREKLLVLGAKHLPPQWETRIDKAFGFVEKL